jgi:hypothetical protein
MEGGNMNIDNIKFSDTRWVDTTCYFIIVLLIMAASLFGTIAFEIILFKLLPYESYWILWSAPIIEETFKFLTLCINISLGVAFTIVFSLWEAARYIEGAVSKGTFTILFFIIRVICIGVHFLTLACQIFGLKMYYKYKSWTLLLLGYLAAVFIHFEWNVEVGYVITIAVIHVYQLFTKILGT